MYYQGLFALSVLIASFRPIFFRAYKSNFLVAIWLSLLSMYIGFLVMTYMKNPEQSFDEYKEQIMKPYQMKNMLYSLLHELKFVAIQYSFMVLPLTFSVPLSLLYIPFTLLFDYFINNNPLTIYELGATLFMLIGILFTKNGSTKKQSKQSNEGFLDKAYEMRGILSGILGAILGSYVYIMLSDIDKKTKDPFYIIGIESGLALVLVSILVLGGYFMGKITMPSLSTMTKMFVLLTFLFNLDNVFKYIGLEKVSVLQSLFISQLYLLVSFLIGVMYYKESFTKNKMIGLVIVLLSSLYGGYVSHDNTL